MVTLMWMMGGSGIRFGGAVPKQYYEIKGHPIFYYALREYSKIELVDRVVIVSHKEWIDYTAPIAHEILKEKFYGIVAGGESRLESVKNGITYIEKDVKCDDVILIHDATNPFVAKETIPDLITAVAENGAGVIGTNQYHTIYQKSHSGYITDVIPRETVGVGYSPEGFRVDVLVSIYQDSDSKMLAATTSTAALAKSYGLAIKFLPANLVNLKITYPDDLSAYEKLVGEEDDDGLSKSDI